VSWVKIFFKKTLNGSFAVARFIENPPAKGGATRNRKFIFPNQLRSSVTATERVAEGSSLQDEPSGQALGVPPLAGLRFL